MQSTTTPTIEYARSRDGASIAFMHSGEGPPAVLVPTVPFSNARMEWQVPLLRHAYGRLAEHLTLVQYDGRGTGHSQRDVSDVSLGAHVADLEAVVDTARLGRFSLIGQYIGCSYALAYAARHPERVARIVLFGGALRGWTPMSGVETQALLTLIDQDWNLFAETAAHAWLGWSAGESGPLTADAFRAATTPQVARATLQAASGVDLTDVAPSVRAPTLVLHVGGVTQLPIEASESLVEALPQARLDLLPGTRPALFLEDPDARIDRLLEFLLPGRTGAAVASTASRRPPSLTSREREVLGLLAAGESNAAIADRLGLSVHTVERHVANVYRKIDARGRADATAWAIRQGLA